MKRDNHRSFTYYFIVFACQLNLIKDSDIIIQLQTRRITKQFFYFLFLGRKFRFQGTKFIQQSFYPRFESQKFGDCIRLAVYKFSAGITQVDTDDSDTLSDLLVAIVDI